jgi:hypothetical protein
MARDDDCLPLPEEAADDAALAVLAARGCTGSFAVLTARHHVAIVHYARRLLARRGGPRAGCEAEDVELARAFRDRGLPPRMNPWSSATTYGVDRQWFTGRHFTTEARYLQHAAAPPPPARPRTIVQKIRREFARVVRQLGGRPR